MPKLVTRPPKYARHKASGQAVAKFSGKTRYLGPYGTPESRAKYHELVAEWANQLTLEPETSGICAVDPPVEIKMTIRELVLQYWTFAEGYYRKNGEPTGTLAATKPALRVVRQMFGTTLIKDFRPSFLERIQTKMIEEGASRSYINQCVARIRQMFRWGVSKELCPVEVLQRLETIRGLAKGRTAARETEPVGPVDEATIVATVPHLPELVADMVRFQRLPGARPGEVCSIRPCDVDRTGDVWRYVPDSHKTEHHGRERVVFIGPRAQAILIAISAAGIHRLLLFAYRQRAGAERGPA